MLDLKDIETKLNARMKELGVRVGARINPAQVRLKSWGKSPRATAG